jgi:hypothetical protein
VFKTLQAVVTTDDNQAALFSYAAKDDLARLVSVEAIMFLQPGSYNFQSDINESPILVRTRPR